MATAAGARLDRLPLCGFHRRILWLVGAGMFFDAFDIYLVFSILPTILHTGFSTPGANATLISAGFAGMAVGAIVAGFLGDRYGRRFSYQANLGIFGVTSIAAALAPNVCWLIAARFVMGIGLGGEIVLGSGTLSEFVPPTSRGRYAGLLAAVTNAGLAASTIAGYLVIPHAGWRWMFAIAGAGAVCVWLARKNMPESPRWLEVKGRHAESEAILCDIEAEAARISPLPGVPIPVSTVAGHAPFHRLFQHELLPATLQAIVLSAALSTMLYGFVLWLPTFFVAQGMSVSKSLGYTSLVNMGAITGGLLGSVLADRIGRRRGIMIFSALGVVLGTGYAVVTSAYAQLAMGFVLVNVIYATLAFGLYGYIPELFPTQYRMRGGSMGAISARLMGMALPFIVMSLHRAFGLAGVMGFLDCILLTLIGCLAIFGIDTRGRSLEDISGTGLGDTSSAALSNEATASVGRR
jgi:MFS transporter, putative metabolite:H+ symporter